MSSNPLMDPQVRERIIADPAVVLDDKDIMRVLVAANERAMGPNVVDLRGIAMDRLEARLDRLEDTHRSVIAAAYDNLSGTATIHRAVIRLLEPTRFETFLRDLGGDVKQLLRVDSLRLVIEADQADGEDGVERLDSPLVMEPRGFVDSYLRAGGFPPSRSVVLRPVGLSTVYEDGIASEACLRLDLGEDVGLLALGSRDPRHFLPHQGTDLLAFLASVVERALRRWLG
ncbi:DUF484 family protein [Rubellimicrobium aerolatum]|uniref:DUF484 family protein n=1 Tax=Rubellimicrobium aerolatum TaxID=490979 RepID=A0ABW0SG77_9RHOB|nr:DUF484 family protein [Rubellimicrobium aerolatum]MBP1805811.1 uncharacterized protein YigA (DUF484 family) [Rubellimicrobium aerolatum]